MCGIFGLLSAGPAPEGLARRAKAFLSHRGPDGAGDIVLPVKGGGSLLFVHTRLSIIDIAGGAQPMWDTAGRWVVVLNGEIYNYLELARELKAEGAKLNTNSDTEVLAAALSQWGAEKAIPMFNGMFAFAAFHPASGELILARDRFGIKPLYFLERPGAFGFCSELGPLIKLGLTGGKISKPGLELYLSQYSLPAPWTMIEGVEKLRPAYMTQIKDGKRRTRRYWSPVWAPVIGDETEALEEFDRLMTRSLKLQYRADVPVGISLSGGLDSCALLAYSKQELGMTPSCFTLGFSDPDFDESHLARLMAERSDAPVKTFVMKPGDLIEQMTMTLERYGEPMGDWGVGLVAFISEMAKKESKVLLIGSGGDELFAGYPTVNAYRYAMIYRKLPLAARKAFKAIVESLPGSSGNMTLMFKLQRFMKGADEAPETGHLRYKEIFSDAERAGLLGRTPSSGFADILANIDHLNVPQEEERLLWIDFNTFMQSNVLAGFDAASMAHGLEMRVPFLDNDLYDFTLKLKPSLKFSLGTTKRLLRKALARRIPKEVLKAPKRGFVYPVDRWLRKELKEEADSLLRSGALSGLGIDESAALRLWGEHLEGRRNSGRQITTLLSLCIWANRVLRTAAIDKTGLNAYN